MDHHCVTNFPKIKGITVTVNARLMNSHAKVSFLAASVWRHGDHVNNSVMENFENLGPHGEDIDYYQNFSQEMSFQIDGNENRSHFENQEALLGRNPLLDRSFSGR